MGAIALRFISILTPLATLLAAQVWMAERNDGAVFQSELFDSYMRLARVRNLMAGGNLHDRTIPRANAPYGHSLHWTRPLDVLLVAGATMLTPILGTANGLHQAGVWLSPLLHLETLSALFGWRQRPRPAGQA